MGRAWQDAAPFPVGWTELSAVQHLLRDLAHHLSPLAQEPVWVVADPRIARLIPVWGRVATELGAKPQAVIVFRHPLDVVASLERRGTVSAQVGLLLWQRHMLDAERATRDWPRVFVDYDRLVEDRPAIIEALRGRLDVPWTDLTPQVEEAVAHLLETGPPAVADRENPGKGTAATLPKVVGHAYEALRELARNDEAQGRVTCDALTAQLEGCDELVGPIIAESERKLRDVEGLLPSEHRRRTQLQDDAAYLREAALFDEAWYLEQNPGVRRAGTDAMLHYLAVGRYAGRNPHPQFDVAWYEDQNPDVVESPMDPFRHYLQFGRFEGRDPSPQGNWLTRSS
jgi:hypothetical protein